MFSLKPRFLKGLYLRLKDLVSYIWNKIIVFIRWYRRTYKRVRWYKKALMLFVTLFCVFFLYLGMVDVNFLWLFGKSPSLETISHPKQDIASVIYSSEGVVLGRYYRENRIPITYEEIPKSLVDALISTEDERFYEHFGIDVHGIFAAVKDMVAHGEARGASTITQQLVKNMFKTRTEYSTGLTGYIPGVKMLVMKTKEWITAVKLEMFFSKQEILTMYLNTVDFGSNSYGIRTASQTYFGTVPSKLTVEQGAVLVGMLKATTTYHPYLNPENSLRRRNTVINNLYTHGKISKQERDSLFEMPLELKYKVPKTYDGEALYFREALADSLGKWCEENDYDLYGGGLKIYTTLDSRMQRYAEEAVKKQMEQVQRNFKADWGGMAPWRDANHQEIPNFIENLAKKTPHYSVLLKRFPNDPDSITHYLNIPHPVKVFDYEEGTKEMMLSTMDSIRYMVKFMHCAFLAIEPQTGNIKAWVGDIDFNHWKYDKVTAHRQPGSTFKLFVYTAAMENGLSPCDERVDQWKQYDAFDSNNQPIKWSPRNSDGTFSGYPVTLRYAFARSLNSIAVSVADEVGMDKVIDVAHKIGVYSPLKNTPSLALGSSDVTLYEMVNSYSTIINDGKYNHPSFITRIEDKYGNVIYEHKPENKQVINYESAFLMQQMLLAGMQERGGTSMALWGYDLHRYDTNFGGKTGTTSQNSDGWYMGVTKNLVGGCWVGGEYRSVHFRTTRNGQGSHTALPVYAYFMEKVLKDPELSSKYRGKILDKPVTPIERGWNCRTVLPEDTIETDSVEKVTVESVSLEGAVQVGDFADKPAPHIEPAD